MGSTRRLEPRVVAFRWFLNKYYLYCRKIVQAQGLNTSDSVLEYVDSFAQYRYIYHQWCVRLHLPSFSPGSSILGCADSSVILASPMPLRNCSFLYISIFTSISEYSGWQDRGLHWLSAKLSRKKHRNIEVKLEAQISYIGVYLSLTHELWTRMD